MWKIDDKLKQWLGNGRTIKINLFICSIEIGLKYRDTEDDKNESDESNTTI